MKVDLFRKFRWYIIGFILVTIMLSVSLSFASWDTTSLNAKLANSGSGSYSEKPDTKYELKTDNNSNGVADVGDTVTFGNYYQVDANTKTTIEWRVVEKKIGTSGKQELTLLAEKVMASGCFWGTNTFYQNYSASTVRQWLNSIYGKRDDKGTAFSANNSAMVYRGFLSEAFTQDEQDYIISKSISGMKGFIKNSTSGYESYDSITDKVWLPSWSEIYGNSTQSWGNTSDGSPSARFSYFSSTNYGSSNTNLVASTTAYAVAGTGNYSGGTGQSGNSWWWLRSPHPSYSDRALVVHTGGSGTNATTYGSNGGVRPAVIVPV